MYRIFIMLSKEELKAKFVYPNDEWKYVDFNNEYNIVNTFDDGNIEFTKYENKWVIFGKWKEKIALYNLANPEIIIASISLWKVNNGIKI